MTSFDDPTLYYRYMHEYVGKIQSNTYGYQFLITKCCGYSFLIHLYKNQTVEDLYNIVQHELQNNGFNKLYIKKPMIHKYLIPRNNSNLKELINNHNLTALYSIPAPVVYRLWLDDGHHKDSICMNCLNN